MRRALLLLGLGAFALAPGAGHATSCASPGVDASPNERRAGQLVLVTGEGWIDHCGEPESCSGCGRCEGGRETTGHEEILLSLKRGGSEESLETIEVEGGFSFAVEVRLPRDLEPGRYRLIARAPAGEHAWTPVTIVD